MKDEERPNLSHLGKNLQLAANVYAGAFSEKRKFEIIGHFLDLLQVDLLASGASLVWPRSDRPRATKSTKSLPSVKFQDE